MVLCAAALLLLGVSSRAADEEEELPVERHYIAAPAAPKGETQAQADANRQLSASLTPVLIQSQAIAKWSGNMPAVLPNGGGVIIDPASLFATTPR